MLSTVVIFLLYYLVSLWNELESTQQTWCMHFVGMVLFGILTVYVASEEELSKRLKKKLSLKKKNLKSSMSAIESKLDQLPGSKKALLELTKRPLSELRECLSNGSLHPADLLHAFQYRALTLYERGNSGIATLLVEAEEWIEKECTGNPTMKKSPIFGIPISLKECFAVSGYDSTMGLLKLCNQPNEDDCVLVKVLKQAGAIPFALTASSQPARSFDGYNPVYGSMKNPLNCSRLVGGSSTGCVVLLVQRGCPISVGSDLAGSIRIPAAFCGLVGFKPTSNRLSRRGMTSVGGGATMYLQASPGPITHSVEDAANLMRALLTETMFSMDPQVPPIHFDDFVYGAMMEPKLRIGYYTSLNDPLCFEAVPAIQEAVEKSVQILRKEGHSVVEFCPPKQSEAVKLFLQAMFFDGGKQLRKQLTNEPLDTNTRLKLFALRLPRTIKRLMDQIMCYSGRSQLAVTSYMGGFSGVSEISEFYNHVYEYKKQFQLEWDRVGPLDAIICPVMPYPAPPADIPSFYVNMALIYSSLYNILDYPAGTVPVGSVTKESVQKAMELSKLQDPKMGKIQRELYRLQEGSEGMPLAVQVVGLPYREETVLRVMGLLERTK